MAYLRQPSDSELLGMAILDVLGLSKLTPVRRIIVDCEHGSQVMVYIEAFSSEKILELDWAEGLGGAEVKVIDKPRLGHKRPLARHGEFGF